MEQLPFKHKTELVYNGIDTTKWKVNYEFLNKIKDELDIDRNVILVAHIGQLIPWKRHDLLIEVAQYLIQDCELKVHYVIIGDDLFDDFPDHKRHLQHMVKSLNLSEQISFLSYRGNLAEYLNGIDILLHLADNEPFGRVIIEAMALEKPVIARNQGGPKEIISDNCSGFLVTSSEPSMIAEKLRILINDSNLRRGFGRVGRSIVKSKFSISNLERIGPIILSVNEECSN